MKPILFWKANGGGNDFIILDLRDRSLDSILPPGFIAKICRRGLSVGADGVILIRRSETADYAWRYYNADGSEAAMCGNGIRCAARFAYLNQIAPATQRIETQDGILEADVLEGEGDVGRVRVQLANPTDLRLHLKINIGELPLQGHFVCVGVPHVVYFSDKLEEIDVVQRGRATRWHPLFAPEGTNVNFVAVLNRHGIKIRTYERGVENETLACGTGSVAAAVIATALGHTDAPPPPLHVQTKSGVLLSVDFKQNDKQAPIPQEIQEVFLEGDARMIYKGELLDEALF